MNIPDKILKANDRALANGYCTVANAHDIKCAQPARYLVTAGGITEPVCYTHLAGEIENALFGVADQVTVELRIW